MPGFNAATYSNLISEQSSSQARLFSQYTGNRSDFDVIIIGSGFGGGVLADDLAERIGSHKRILVLEAGSYLYPTHVYNICRFANASVAANFKCRTFTQAGDEHSREYIHEQPQLNFGGRSIFWSGLIPAVQPWELDFFPPRVRAALEGGLLNRAGETMNESVSMGSTARAIVAKLRQSSLAQDFVIEETPRALHQPYLSPLGVPNQQTFEEPTGVFNTAELLINQLGLASGPGAGDGPGLHLLLNRFVENVERLGDSRFRVDVVDTTNDQRRSFFARMVVLSGGTIESPKIIRRSPTLYNSLQPQVRSMVGVGITDHPTTNELSASITNLANVQIPRDSHAKIIMYSRGRRNPQDQIMFPFNMEMNINHEYWHLRENDPSETHPVHHDPGASRLDIKFSFANPIYGGNSIDVSSSNGGDYTPPIHFRNMNWTDHLVGERFPALAGWHGRSADDVWWTLNEVSNRVFSQFQNGGADVKPDGNVWFGQNGKGFGYGTVHHAACSLRMPFRWAYDMPFEQDAVVSEDLELTSNDNIYVCDMSVMPLSSAANPVRSLIALALRLSERLASRV
jgi:choline dehydrogenase-like flavoprotein